MGKYRGITLNQVEPMAHQTWITLNQVKRVPC